MAKKPLQESCDPANLKGKLARVALWVNSRCQQRERTIQSNHQVFVIKLNPSFDKFRERMRKCIFCISNFEQEIKYPNYKLSIFRNFLTILAMVNYPRMIFLAWMIQVQVSMVNLYRCKMLLLLIQWDQEGPRLGLVLVTPMMAIQGMCPSQCTFCLHYEVEHP